jgi:hypothetical protein
MAVFVLPDAIATLDGLQGLAGKVGGRFKASTT